MKKRKLTAAVMAAMLVFGAVEASASAVKAEAEPVYGYDESKDEYYVSHYEWGNLFFAKPWVGYEQGEDVLRAGLGGALMFEHGSYDDITELIIPESVNDISVTSLKVDEMPDCPNLTSITIPTSIKYIYVYSAMGYGYESFDYSNENLHLDSVYYEGTREQWEDILIDLQPAWEGKFNEKSFEPFSEAVEAGAQSWEFEYSAAEYLFGDTTIYFSDGTSVKTTEYFDDDTKTDDTDETDKPAADNSDDSNPATTPGDSDKQTVLDVTLKNVDSENGIEGEALDKLLFGDSGWTWEQVEKIEFTSDDLFSVEYKAEDGWRALGGDAVLRASDDVWNTAWTLNTDDMAKSGKAAKVIAKDGTIDVIAKIYIKQGAEKPEDGANANTGIALAIAPAVLAAGFVIVAAKKRK